MKFSAFALVCVLGLTVSACGGSSDTPTSPSAPTINVPFSTVDVRVGTGAEANTGRVVTVNYAGYIYSATAPENKGTRFDGPGTLTNITVGGNFISGFNQGMIGMRVGGLRRVIIPPSLGYGNIPPPTSIIRANETLVFDIEMIAVQ
jgi:FKBP-type peptidyl-prolyl cis-trans isomerase FkpA